MGLLAETFLGNCLWSYGLVLTEYLTFGLANGMVTLAPEVCEGSHTAVTVNQFDRKRNVPMQQGEIA